MKKQYEQPELIVYGSVEELTQGSNAGTQLDSVVPVGANPLLHLGS